MSNIPELEETQENSEEVAQEVISEDTLADLSKEDIAAALLKEHASKNQLYARATKAEAELKKQKSAAVFNKPLETEQVNLEEQIDLRFLQRDGLTAEDIDQLKFIQSGAKGTGKTITLLEAQNHPLYKAYRTEQDLLAKKARAQIIPGGGGGTSGKEAMTEDQHKTFAAEKAKAILDRLGG